MITFLLSGAVSVFVTAMVAIDAYDSERMRRQRAIMKRLREAEAKVTALTSRDCWRTEEDCEI